MVDHKPVKDIQGNIKRDINNVRSCPGHFDVWDTTVYPVQNSWILGPTERKMAMVTRKVQLYKNQGVVP